MEYGIDDYIVDKSGEKRFKVIAILGRGGMGTVYKVEDMKRKDTKALKVINSEYRNDNIFLELLNNEYKISLKLNDENIVKVYEDSDKLPYYMTMQYIDGINLEEWIREIGLEQKIKKLKEHHDIIADLEKNADLRDENTIVDKIQQKKKQYIIDKESYINNILLIINKICLALNNVHSKGFFHRDIKPTNIMVEVDENYNILNAYLLDFGIAKLLDQKMGLLTEHGNEGSRYYMAPEAKLSAEERASRNMTLDSRADIYSMSKVVFKLLTGKTYDKSVPKIASIINPVVTTRLDLIIKKAMSKNPNHRDKYIQEFLNGIKGGGMQKNEQGVILTIDDKHSFKINEQDGDNLYYFTIDDEGNPIKIGDGTFGVVYKCHNKRMQLSAVKLFYEKFVSDEGESVALNRFKFESDSAVLIRKTLFEKGFPHDFSGLIDNDGGTYSFKQYPAYSTFTRSFEKSNIKISDYALVMPLYQHTLKDLLEKGTGKYSVNLSATDKIAILPKELEHLTSNIFSKEELVKVVDNLSQIQDKRKEQIKANNVYEAVGYDILKKKGFAQRIKTMLPFLQDIAKGIRTLHLAEMYHLDLKPANIFVRKRTDEVDCVLGDLGFLESQNLKKIHESKPDNRLSLGTRHYRSPEQLDFFDICDAQVTHHDGNVVLIIRDPKFMETIIEELDIIVFSKDIHDTAYKIEQIEFDIKKNMASLTLENLNEQPLIEIISEDQCTQIVLYKNQQVRTDLFGFGAVVYDMLTCGKPPERFYQNIRHFDKESESVDKIMQLYIQVSSYQSDQSGMVDFFGVFKDNHSLSYAPPEIVELILKCMLYKAQKTFVHPEETIRYSIDCDYYKAIDSAIEYLSKLDIKYHASRNKNDLLDGDFTEPIDMPTSSFANKIEELQDNNTSQTLPVRFAIGVWFLSKLAKLVEKSLTSPLKGEDANFFSEMLPENIDIGSSELSFFYHAYKIEELYKKDLIDDRVYTKITRNISNPFVPDSMAFIRRELRLEELANNKFRYRFLDSSIRGDYLQTNDFIIINSRLFSINDVDVIKNEITLTIDEYSSSDDSDNMTNIGIDSKKKYIYYSAIEPCKYYFKMMACYMYHIFYVGIEGSSTSKPLITNKIFNYSYLSNNWNFFIEPLEKIVHKYDSEAFSNADAKQQFKYIHILSSYLYLKLAFPENEHSYYNDKADDINRILSVSNAIEDLQKMIETFLGLELKTLGLSLQQIEKEVETKRMDWSDFGLELPNFQTNIHMLTNSKFEDALKNNNGTSIAPKRSNSLKKGFFGLKKKAK